MPGTWLEISEEGLRTGTYYDVIARAESGAFENKTAQEHFEAALKRAVERQKTADVPLGAFLSGGTDSSLLVAMFQEQSTEPVRTFTIGFDVATHDESAYAAAVAQKLGTAHTWTRVSENESLAWAEKICAAYDEPFAVSSCIPMLLLSETTRRHVTVAFSGDGGDELFMGYGYYAWHDRIETLRRWGLRKPAKAVLSLGGDRHKNAAETLDFPAGVPAWPRVWSRQQGMFSEAEISRLTGQKYIHSTVAEDWERLLRLNIHPYERISLFDVKRYLAEDLMYKTDIASMHYGLEVRVPYLDVNVVETALSLPLTMRRDGAQAKVLMKAMLERRLPREWVHRTKWGFPAPTGVWLSGKLAPLIDHYLNEKRLTQQGIFHAPAVGEYVRRFRAGEKRLHSRLWNLLIFQMWHKQYAS
jgi:asparagine synthase (glutamine-hydrolysing)